MFWMGCTFTFVGFVIGFMVAAALSIASDKAAVQAGIWHHKAKFYRLEQIDPSTALRQ